MADSTNGAGLWPPPTNFPGIIPNPIPGFNQHTGTFVNPITTSAGLGALGMPMQMNADSGSQTKQKITAPRRQNRLLTSTGTILGGVLPTQTSTSSAGLGTPVTQTTAPAHTCQKGRSCSCNESCNSNIEEVPKLASKSDLTYKITGADGLVQTLQVAFKGLRHIDLSLNLPGSNEFVKASLKLEPNLGWQFITNRTFVKNGVFIVPQYIPSSATISDIALGFWAGTTALSLLKDKIQAKSNKDQTSSVNLGQANDNCAPMDISNAEDMTCSAGIGDTTVFHYSCGVEVTVNLRSCCITHDIECWCGPPINWDSGSLTAWDLAISTQLAGCFAGKILSSAQNAHIPWYCGGEITAYIEAVAAAAVIFALTEIAVFLAVLTLGETNSPSVPVDGRNKKSCLCGGTVPTIASSGEGMGSCFDLCKDQHKSETCYPCGWVCDSTQNPPKAVWTPNAPPGQCCCPDTASGCLTQGPAPKCCYDCSWSCDWFDADVYEWNFVSDPNIPCCDPNIASEHTQGALCSP